MKVKAISSNMTQIETERGTVLFSYGTPVAACVPGKGFFRTENKWSATTTRHINKWLDGRPAEARPQEFFDKLLD